jgi:site-specific DNA recombinase
VDDATWRAVQERRAAKRHPHHRRRASSVRLLAGRRLDKRVEAMVPSGARMGGVRYRYNVARAVGLDGERLRLPAAPIEAAIVAGLRSVAPSRPATLGDAPRSLPTSRR